MAWAPVACLLPENPYQRWQLLDGTIHANLRWIYERTNFDPTPIDVMFVGPSRIEKGVDAPRLGRDLAARGLPAHVVNFALPEAGRNINYLIVKETLEHKTPKLIVIGVTEKPSRFGHSAFKYIAPAPMILDPGYPADANYFSDLIYLPFRQMRLFAADVLPGGLGLAKTFQPGRLSRSLDRHHRQHAPAGRDHARRASNPPRPPELARGVRKLERGMHPPFLGKGMADIEFGDERHYIQAIADLAHAHGVKVAFLFLPYYTGPSALQEQAFYDRFGPVWNAGYVSSHADEYADYGHLTHAGAEGLTDWLAGPVFEALNPEKARR